MGPAEAAPANRAELAALIEGLRPWAHERSMVNFISPDEGLTATALRAIYGAALYDRIADVKQKYDPSNMFRHNHTIVAL